MIHLYTRNATLQKLIERETAGEALGGIKVETPNWVDRPRAAQYVITKNNLNRDIERFAASLGAMPVVLPEATMWLIERLRQANAAGIETRLVGSDYMRMSRNGD